MNRDQPATAVAALARFIDQGESGLSHIPDLLAEVLTGRYWETGYWDFLHDKQVHPKSFLEFVTAEPMEGLGTTVEFLRKNIPHELKSALDEVLQRPPGNPTGRNQYSGTVFEQLGDEHWCIDGCNECEGGNVDNVHNSERPTGNSESTALRRLRKDRPDLHAQVLNGELSAHAAAVQAGFRPKTCTIRTDKPESIVATLRRQLAPETLAMVTKLLAEET